MQTIGSDLYVHAGLGKNFYDRNLSIPTVNEEMSKALFMNKKERRALSPLTAFLYGKMGPLVSWPCAYGCSNHPWHDSCKWVWNAITKHIT